MNAAFKPGDFAAAATPAFTDENLELALLGRIVRNSNSAWQDAVAHCEAGDFAFDAHVWLFELFALIADEGEIISQLTVSARAGRTIKTDIGKHDAATVLASIRTAADDSRFEGASVRMLARAVSELALRRRIDAELEAGRMRLAERNSPVTAAIAGVVSVTGEAIDRAARARGYRPIGEVADAILQAQESALNGTAPPAIRTEIASLDALTGGLHPGDMAIVAGRPGMGKSVMLSHIALRAALAGSPALFFSLEMPASQLLERMVCDIDFDARGHGTKPLQYESFRGGKVTDGEFTRLYNALRKLRELPLEIHDTGGLSMPQISAVAERYAARTGKLGVVVVDYLQLVSPGDRYRGRKVDEVGEVTAAAKALAKRIGWPVVLGCQLNRAVEARENKRPTLADLRDSGTIEQDADIVMALYRPAYYAREKRPARGAADPAYAGWLAEYRAVASDLEIAVLKNRHGRAASVMAECCIGASAIRNQPGTAETIAPGEYPEEWTR